MAKIKIKKRFRNWIIILSIILLLLAFFIIFYCIQNENIKQWLIYNKTNCNIYNLYKYTNRIKNNEQEIIKYYSYINYYIQLQNYFNLNQIQISSLNYLLKINIFISPLLTFPIVLFFFFIYIIFDIICFVWFIVFISKCYLYKKYYWFYYDIVENINYYIE